MYRSLINTSTGIWVKKLNTSHPKYDKNTVQNNALTLLRYLISWPTNVNCCKCIIFNFAIKFCIPWNCLLFFHNHHFHLKCTNKACSLDECLHVYQLWYNRIEKQCLTSCSYYTYMYIRMSNAKHQPQMQTYINICTYNFKPCPFFSEKKHIYYRLRAGLARFLFIS